jgi:hypothetical protein
MELTQRDIVTVLGVHPKQFQTLVARGVFPNAPGTSGTGDWRRYSAAHAVGFGWLAAMIEFGLAPATVRKIAPSLDFPAQHGDHEWLVLRNAPESASEHGRLIPEDEVINWVGDDGTYLVGACTTEQLPRALAEAGEVVIVLHAGEIERRVLAAVERLKVAQ